jgi:hypothetical protein
MVAIGALVGLALPATAVPVTIAPGGTWPTFPNADNIGFFEATLTSSGDFTHSYFLNTTQTATIETTSASNSGGDISGFQMFLINLADLSTVAFDITPGSGNSLFFSVANLLAGNYRLDVIGNGPLGAVYNGNVELAFAETPLPGALVLMGTILLGGASLSRWRKGRAQAAFA